MDRKLLAVILLSAVLCLLPGRLHAEWTEGGNILDNEVYDASNARVIADGEGGFIVFWERYINDGGYLKHDIYAQRLDKYGNELWTPGGVVICNAIDEQGHMDVASDGAGGYIVCWSDYRSGTYGDIYAQRIDNSGTVQWTANGIAVCSAANSQYYNVITTVEGGGAIIAWLDYRGGSYLDVYAQRIDNSGTALWTADGVAACTWSAHKEDLRIMHTAEKKGVQLFWEDSRNASSDIYGNMIDSLGTAAWGTTGNGLITDSSNQNNPEVVDDGNGGALISWVDMRNGNADIYAARVYNGSVYWAVNGVPVCTASGHQNTIVMQKYGQYGSIISWSDFRASSDADIYAQRHDFWGNMLWTSDGIAICTYARWQAGQQIVVDGNEDIIFAWIDPRDVDHDIYVQKISPDGTAQWQTDGQLFMHEYYQRGGISMVADGMGGAYMAWQDQRLWQTRGYDIYAYRFDGTGYWGYPAPDVTSIDDVPHDQGGQVLVEFDAGALDVYPYEVISHYTIWRSLSGAESAMMFAGRDKDPSIERTGPEPRGGDITFRPLGAAMYAWESVGTVDAHRLETYSYAAATLHDSVASEDGMHYFFVSSNTEDPFVYWDSAVDSAYSVDNLAPAVPVGLAGEQQYTPEGMQLTWDDNTEPDLAGYRVYRGTSSDFVPEIGSLVDETGESELLDGTWEWEAGYYYKVSAVDVHGNESGYALLAPGGVTGEDPLEVPGATFLAQNFPNPFNPSTRIAFGLKRSGHVSLRIYDTAGRLVRTLVDESRQAGSFEAEWNGLDSSGAAVASGVYFYRLSAAEFLETRKMILIR